MIKIFIYEINECESTWIMKSFIEDKVREIREQVGEPKGSLQP